MAFWNRNQQEVSNLPPEYAQYYQTEPSGGGGKRVVMAIISIAVGLAVLVLLFLAARWAYRQASNPSDAVQNPVSTENIGGASTSDSPAASSNPAMSTTTPSPSTTSTPQTTPTTALPSTGIDE